MFDCEIGSLRVGLIGFWDYGISYIFETGIGIRGILARDFGIQTVDGIRDFDFFSHGNRDSMKYCNGNRDFKLKTR